MRLLRELWKIYLQRTEMVVKYGFVSIFFVPSCLTCWFIDTAENYFLPFHSERDKAIKSRSGFSEKCFGFSWTFFSYFLFLLYSVCSCQWHQNHLIDSFVEPNCTHSSKEESPLNFEMVSLPYLFFQRFAFMKAMRRMRWPPYIIRVLVRRRLLEVSRPSEFRFHVV